MAKKEMTPDQMLARNASGPEDVNDVVLNEDDDEVIELEAGGVFEAGQKYLGKVMDAERTTSQKGNPQIRIQFGFYDPEGNTSMWVSLTPAARWKHDETMLALGIEPVDNDAGKKVFKYKISDLFGRHAMCEFEKRTINDGDRKGEEQISIKKLHPAKPSDIEKYSSTPV